MLRRAPLAVLGSEASRAARRRLAAAPQVHQHALSDGGAGGAVQLHRKRAAGPRAPVPQRRARQAIVLVLAFLNVEIAVAGVRSQRLQLGDEARRVVVCFWRTQALTPSMCSPAVLRSWRRCGADGAIRCRRGDGASADIASSEDTQRARGGAML